MMKFLSTNWLKTKNSTNFFLVLILLIAAFLRLWGIWRLNFFTYDQARDALFIKRIIVDYKLRLIGTQTSIPGVYTPPLYYYLMAPVLAIFRLNPIGLDYATVILNILAIFVFYLCLLSLTKNELVSLAFSALYAFHPTIIHQSRFAWNPNTMPLFTLLAIWSLMKIFDDPKNLVAYIILFFSLGMNINLHYAGIVFAIAVLTSLLLLKRKEIYWKGFALGGIVFSLEVMPVFLFDLRHGFLIVKNIIRYLRFGTGGEIPPPPILMGVWQKFSFLLGLVFGQFRLNLFFNLVVLAFLFAFLIKNSRKLKFRAVLLIFFLSLIFSSIYRGSFFSFYLLPLFPLPFLIAGKVVSIFSKKRIFYCILLTFTLLFCLQNLSASFRLLQTSQRNNHERLMNIARFLSSRVEENFNLASLYSSPDRYDRNAVDYRYFLEAFFDKRAFDWDPEDYKTATNLYFITQAKEIDPLKSGIWEVQTFDPKEIKNEWKVEDVVIYHLVK